MQDIENSTTEVRTVVRTPSLTDKTTRKLYAEMAQDSGVGDERWYPKLHEHTTRRNEIVHGEGALNATADDYKASRHAVTECITRVLAKIGPGPYSSPTVNTSG